MDKNTILILEGSKQPFISVSRYYGGFTMNGKTYIYMPLQDAFLRQDWVKKYTAHIKKGGNWNTFIELIKKQ
jgi:hypothetical protein